MTARIFILISAAGIMTACTTVPDAPNTSSGASVMKAQGLSARNLAAGECGLFVWTADANKNFILFAQSQKQQANWLSPVGEITLTLDTQSGSALQSQYPQQSYNLNDASKLAIDLRQPQSIQDGTRYRAGTLSQTGADGWARVTPIVALSACKPALNSGL